MRRVRSPRIALGRSDRPSRWRSSGGGDSSGSNLRTLSFCINTLSFESCNSQDPESLESIELVLTFSPSLLAAGPPQTFLDTLFDPQHCFLRSPHAPRAPPPSLASRTFDPTPHPRTFVFVVAQARPFPPYLPILHPWCPAHTRSTSAARLDLATQPLGPRPGSTTTARDVHTAPKPVFFVHEGFSNYLLVCTLCICPELVGR
jgi:hypothetical protein